MSFKITEFGRRTDKFRFGAEIILPMRWSETLSFSCINALDLWCVKEFGGYQKHWVGLGMRKDKPRGRTWTGAFTTLEQRTKFLSEAKNVILVTRLTS